MRIIGEIGKKERKYGREYKKAEELYTLTKYTRKPDYTTEALALLSQLKIIMNQLKLMENLYSASNTKFKPSRKPLPTFFKF